MKPEARTAIEALRAGVPNGAAIRQMDTEQTGIDVLLITGSFASDYTEDTTLAEPTAPDDEEA